VNKIKRIGLPNNFLCRPVLRAGCGAVAVVLP
jgi:hypothetical protein